MEQKANRNLVSSNNPPLADINIDTAESVWYYLNLEISFSRRDPFGVCSLKKMIIPILTEVKIRECSTLRYSKAAKILAGESLPLARVASPRPNNGREELRMREQVWNTTEFRKFAKCFTFMLVVAPFAVGVLYFIL